MKFQLTLSILFSLLTSLSFAQNCNVAVNITNTQTKHCIDVTSVGLTADQAGGTFSGPGVQNGKFYPATAGVGIHTIVYTYNDNGCVSSDSLDFTVNALPVVDATSDYKAVCAGSYITLKGAGAKAYVWSQGVHNGMAFIPQNTQKYTVTGTDGNGCKNTDTITVVVSQGPVLTATASATTICNGSSVTLNGTGAATLYWNNGIANGQTVAPTATTTYILKGKDAIGCSGIDSVTVVVQNCNNVAEVAMQEVSVYPNPTSGRVMVDLSTIEGTVIVNVYHMSGQLVRTQQLAAGTILNLDLSSEAAGLYLLDVRTKNKQIGQYKVIKQ